MKGSALFHHSGFVKLAALAALLLVAVLVLDQVVALKVSTADAPRDTHQFLNDISRHRKLTTGLLWLAGIGAVLIIPLFGGLYHALRRNGEDAMRIAVLFGVLAAVFLALSAASRAPLPGYIGPAWSTSADDAGRAALLGDAKIIAWTNAGLVSMFDLTIAVAVFAASLVMARLPGSLWRSLQWVGVIGAAFGLLATFAVTAKGMEFAAPVHGVLALVWLLGVGWGLWRLPSAPASPAA